MSITSFSPGQWQDLWQSVCRILEETVVPHQLHAWVHPLQWSDVEQSEEGKIKVKFLSPNDFSAQWVRDHYQKIIEKALSQTLGMICEIELEVKKMTSPSSQKHFLEDFVVSDSSSFESLSSTSEVQAPENTENSLISHSDEDSLNYSHGMNKRNSNHFPVSEPDPLIITHKSFQRPLTQTEVRSSIDVPDPKYVFENFVVGASNQFAHASAVAVADHPARQYNPLFLYSPPGLGKTHLLHAIGNRLLDHNPEARVAYLSAEKFVNELIDSLQHRRMSQFRSKYRNSYDMILIDDIQFIAGKNTSEEEFFHTFNALHSSKRQIVVTSDRPPKEIEGLEERVRTRFEWGLVADISPPEIETRIAILKTKAERDDIYLPDDVSTFLASYIKTNVRELEGILIRLQAQASLTGSEISLEMAKYELRNLISQESSHFTIDSIQSAVAKHYRLKVQDLKAHTRAKSVSLPRQIAMYLIRKYTGVGFKEIGHCFGGKDHTTILHACNKIEHGLSHEGEIRDAVEAIQNLL